MYYKIVLFTIFVTCSAIVYGQDQCKYEQVPQKALDLQRLSGVWFARQIWLVGYDDTDGSLTNAEFKCVEAYLSPDHRNSSQFFAKSQLIVNGTYREGYSTLLFAEDKTKFTVHTNDGIVKGIVINADQENEEDSFWIEYYCFTYQERILSGFTVYTRSNLINIASHEVFVDLTIENLYPGIIPVPVIKYSIDNQNCNPNEDYGRFPIDIFLKR